MPEISGIITPFIPEVSHKVGWIYFLGNAEFFLRSNISFLNLFILVWFTFPCPYIWLIILEHVRCLIFFTLLSVGRNVILHIICVYFFLCCNLIVCIVFLLQTGGCDSGHFRPCSPIWFCWLGGFHFWLLERNSTNPKCVHHFWCCSTVSASVPHSCVLFLHG
jgi:hypothetical protein